MVCQIGLLLSLKLEAHVDPEVKNYFADISIFSKKMRVLVKDMLDFSRLETANNILEMGLAGIFFTLPVLE